MSPAELAAETLRRYPSSVPVNIRRIIRAECIVLRPVYADPDNFNGMYIRLRDRPVILYNGKHPATRRRFTFAHELCHHFDYLLHPGEWQLQFYEGPKPVTVSEIRTERRADRYAAALLMPAEVVCRLHRDGVGMDEMAKHFGVSGDAMYIRLVELSLVKRARRL